MADRGLLFVYKADSGLFNTASDIAHKIFSPDTYECNLCALTHGYFTIRKEWEAFIRGLGLPTEYLHRDELDKADGVDAGQLPAVYRWHDEGWRLCLGPDAINGCDGLEQLEILIKERCIGSEPR